MVEKIKLVQVEASAIFRGSIFRVSGKFPYEDVVDFMLFETHDDVTPYGFIVVSGYKAGLILVRLPKESLSSVGGVDKAWILANWNIWIYPDCDVSDVYFIETPVVSSVGGGFEEKK